jgi:hypothetical protein
MKGKHYHYLLLLEMMSTKYGNRLGIFLANRLAREINRTGDCCISHLRVARSDNEIEMKIFKKISDDGCCGSKEWKVTFNSNDAPSVDYWLGFNYGH